MRTTELGIMIMMVVVRASPNRAGAQDQNSKDPHQPFGQPRTGQYRLVLLIVINYEKPQIKQPGEETAHDSASEMDIPESPHH